MQKKADKGKEEEEQDDRYPPGQHPQELIINDIVNNLMTKRFGADWLSKAKQEMVAAKGENESEFDKNLRKYGSPQPKHEVVTPTIRVEDIKSELKQCI